MDKPVMFFLVTIALLFFLFGTWGIFSAKGKSWKIILSILMIGMAAFIAYGLDTQCENVAVYRKC